MGVCLICLAFAALWLRPPYGRVLNSPGLQAQGVLEPEDEPHAFSLRSFSALLALAKSLGGAQTPCI